MDLGNDMGGGMPPMGGDMPPQDGPMPPMGQEGGDMPPMDNGMGGESEFDTNFDPGVEADEDQDPKKFIQQLTGKLSQSIRNYNEDNGQPDADLNKYVAGMIVKQALEGLSEEDAEEILDKVKAGDVEGEAEGEDMPPQDGPMPPMGQEGGQDQMGGEMPPQGDEQFQQPNEASNRNGNRIDELVNDIMNNISGKEKDSEIYNPQTKKGTYNRKPYTSPF